jgi:hypothetical protein
VPLRCLKVPYSMCLMLFLLGTPAVHAQFVKAKGTQIVDASGKPLLIRGISIGNWMVPEGYFWHFGPINTYQRDVEAVFEDLLGLRLSSFSTSGSSGVFRSPGISAH